VAVLTFIAFLVIWMAGTLSRHGARRPIACEIALMATVPVRSAPDTMPTWRDPAITGRSDRNADSDRDAVAVARP
jgi:hypothetical protein